EWDGWPSGNFKRHFTMDEVNEMGNLAIHWAHIVQGGFRKGDKFAAKRKEGKKSTRKCCGIINCDNEDCGITLRPTTKPHTLHQQLQKRCTCGARLFHAKCDVVSTLQTWAGGIYYKNGGYHMHQRPPRILHLLPDQKKRFEKTLIVGAPGVEGPGESVADISDVFLNADRVGKERLKLKRGADTGGDSFIRAFAKFDSEHPGLVILSTIGKVTVISVQTRFMRSQLVKEDVLDGPINGMVSDAAHGWWKERTSLLVVSSTYCRDLFCWVPGVLSFTNGASAEHYMYHFLAVIKSIVDEAEDRKLEIGDYLFAGVRNGSFIANEAERLGFINAFVEFWSGRADDNRSRDELYHAATNLLRGCQEHFRAGVTRVSRISGAVPP
ncbi:hypothetical protein FPV67DRAFT_1357277, partial [Lyophyllum atratum]